MANATEEPPPRLLGVKIVTFLWMLCIPPSLLTALFSPMMFDAPDANKSVLTWLLFASVATSPFVLLAAVTGCAVTASQTKRFNPTSARRFAVLPVVNIVVFVVADILLKIICGGNFACG